MTTLEQELESMKSLEQVLTEDAGLQLMKRAIEAITALHDTRINKLIVEAGGRSLMDEANKVLDVLITARDRATTRIVDNYLANKPGAE